MNIKLEFLHKLIRAYHEDCIKNILAKKNIHDDVKKFLIDKHLNRLKQVDEAYNNVDTLDKVRELIRKD